MAYVTLGILFAMNVLNFVDRTVLTGMLPLIKEDWHLADSSLGLLVSAYVATYMIFSPVFGWLGDRVTRKWIAGAGVAVWSVCTVASAVAQNFGQLYALRMILGIGEASYAAIAPTMIADLFPPRNRSKVLGFFYMAIPIGHAFGYILGGQLGVQFGWRAAFLIVGLPGLIMALAILFVKEPLRGESEGEGRSHLSDHSQEPPPLKAYWTLSRNKSYIYMTVGMIFMMFSTHALATWMPTFFYRYRGVSLDQSDLFFGLATLVGGILGIFIGSWFADRIQSRFKAAYCMVSGVGMLLTVPFLVVAIYFESPVIFWSAVFMAVFFLFVNQGPTNAVLINVVMPKIRVGAFAINIFLTHALGDLLSPAIVGLVSDRANLQLALLTVAPVAMALSGMVWLLGMRHQADDTKRVAEQMKAEKQGEDNARQVGA
jgi:predicted MFS family arabinose efflux permease